MDDKRYIMYIGTKHSAAYRRYNGKLYKDRTSACKASKRIASNPRYSNYGTIWILSVKSNIVVNQKTEDNR